MLTTTSPEQYRGEVPGHSGIEIRRAPVLRDRNDYVRGYLQYLSFDIPAFFRVLFTRRLDAVVVEPPPTTGAAVRLACGIRRIPYVYYLADIWSDAAVAIDSPGPVARILRRVELFALNGAATVISASKEFSDRIAELGVRSRVVTVGNGADETLFTAEGPRRSIGHPYLLYAGTASEMHGAAIFIDAIARLRTSLPDARVVFVGQGADRELLEKSAERLAPGAVLFEPRLSSSETAEWIRGAAATLASVRPATAYRPDVPREDVRVDRLWHPRGLCGHGARPHVRRAARHGLGGRLRRRPGGRGDAPALTTPASDTDRARLAARAAADYLAQRGRRRAVDAVADVLSTRSEERARL